MKLYRRHLKIDDRQEMHLMVDHYLEPIEMPDEDDIKAAASEYEKIACCEKDHPFLKVYVNEDFEAGVDWILSKLKGE